VSQCGKFVSHGGDIGHAILMLSIYLCTDQFKTSSSPPGIPREFDFKSSPGSREFDVLGLPCGGAFDNGVGNLNRKS
jgi:hypothetical protein